ncbi:MAG: hypothetical protein OEY34_08150, partial [Cyclobacteriaceae bacterium]|nr:hypothetical protein [Cyclobacteriaceae bacterium]
MNIIKYCSIILLVQFACSTTTTNSYQTPTYQSEFELFIYDTIEVKVLDQELKFFDQNNKTENFLLMSKTNGKIIYEIDTLGNLINAFDFIGQGDTLVGDYIFNLSYYYDTAILVNGRNGFYFYDLSGKFIKKSKEITAIRGYGGSRNLNTIPLIINNQEFLLLSLKNSLNEQFVSNFNHHSINEYKGATLYNLNNNKYGFVFPIEDNSIYRQKKMYYGDILTYFTSDGESYYVIHNPDKNLYQYDLNFKLLNVIDLKPKYFKTPITYHYNEIPTIEKGDDIVNSLYRELNANEDYVWVTYRSGIPMEEFNAMQSFNDLPRLFQTFMKYYLIVLSKENTIIDNVRLPFPAVGVAHFKNPNSMILYTNSAV